MTRKAKIKKNTLRKIGIAISSLALCVCLTLTAVIPSWQDETVSAESSSTSNISKVDNVEVDITDYLSESTTEQLSSSIADDDEISVIVQLSTDSVLEKYNASKKIQSEYDSVAEYALSTDGSAILSNVSKQNMKLQTALSKAGVQYTVGQTYNVLFGGFEIITKAKYFDQICDTLSGKATVIVGEEYALSDTTIVTNDVNVYDTGIFDSSDSDYDGSGVVIAVIDAGLDYTHSAFDVSRWSGEEVLTVSNLSDKISTLNAASITPGLTAEDVYLSAKIPFAYDYADEDTDVFPINSEHGTHVSGIIVGNDDVITGVAPNAQLVFMKSFSETYDSARTSWLLSAVQDCVLLGVDVINMSVGAAAGFSREVDKLTTQEIYDSAAEAGITLVAAGGNNYNSTYGSEKNGTLALTSNPDSGTVSTPASYDSTLAVASVSGTKTPYLISSTLGEDTPIYITEAAGAGTDMKDFVEEALEYNGATQSGTLTLEYVTIPGVGRNADYTGLDVEGKIVLVKRGSINFEDKVRIAKEKGAAACIVYNNVSGDISMSVGNSYNDYPVCSISKDDGTALAAVESGTITISTSNVAGPFMSDFSSWGPTSDLKIKPEITAHGGDIYSCVPGQSYDRLSGTSMASPNQAGVTALLRQYVQEKYPEATSQEIMALANQIMMSTADIIYNSNGLAASVRKQGAGLANLTEATSTPAYVQTYGEDGEAMDKTKIELGDDPNKTGVYTMTFDIVNMESGSLTYNIDALVMSEGVSETYTDQGLTTTTGEGYELTGASVSVSVVSGGTANGNSVTVSGNGACKVKVTITLSDEDKSYLDKSFENGMYVEGFVTLTAENGTTIDMSVPYLAFYGDWTQAPLLDLDYYATNADELDDSIDEEDKTKADTYATVPLGGLYNDYIVYLGAYAFTRDPSATAIAADRKYISLSNQNTGDTDSTVHSISQVYAGLLRGAKQIDITIENAVTGEVIFTKTDYNVKKSYASGTTQYASAVDIGFEVSDYDLKNNTQYIVTLTGYVDYGDGGLSTNLNNTFSFPFTVDFEAPTLTDVSFRTTYDKDSKSYKLYADVSIYDNHYSQGALFGYIYDNNGTYTFQSFDKYITALYSSCNSTYTFTYELTDYLDEIKSSWKGNTFVVQTYDYAQNGALYEVEIPDSITSILFSGDRVSEDETTGECTLDLSLNETFSLSEIISVLPSDEWVPSLNYYSSDEEVVRVVNGKLVGVSEGSAYITAVSNSDDKVSATLKVNVVDDGKYDTPVADSFTITSYLVNKVFYFTNSSDRDLYATTSGTIVQFTSSSYYLTMYPSESVTLQYKLYNYLDDDNYKISFTSSNESVVTVDDEGTIVGQAEGSATISVRVLMKNSSGEYSSTLYSQSVSITIKDPYTITSGYLMSYYGLGGTVVIPSDKAITEIYSYAFSGSQYVDKDENDVIDEEDPTTTKQSYYGDDTITEVVVPEGVEVIGAYAFANLTALTKITLPSTLTKIQYGAFYNCTALREVAFSGENNLQFINSFAFENCYNLTSFSFDSIIAIGDRAFANSGIASISLPETAQSIGTYAFYDCTALAAVTIEAEKVKLGVYAFSGCSKLTQISVNASVIPAGVFSGCESLTTVTLGKDVSVIAQYAFANTAVTSFVVSGENATFKSSGGAILSGTTLVYVAPNKTSYTNGDVTAVAEGAFAGNTTIRSISLKNVTSVEAYTFADCTSLNSVTLGTLTYVGDYAFYNTALTSMPTLSDDVTSIGAYAFYGTSIRTVSIADGVTVGDYAFANMSRLTSVTLGNGVTLGEYAFGQDLESAGKYTYLGSDSSNNYYYSYTYTTSGSLSSVTFGDDVTIGDYAFSGTALTSVAFGSGNVIGNYAFYGCLSLGTVDLSKAASVGDYAFAGYHILVYYTSEDDRTTYTEAGYVEEVSSNYSGATIQSATFTTVDLSSLTHLGAYAFMNTSVANVTFGSSLSEIGEGAFYACGSLKSITIPDGAGSIGDYAFYESALEGSVDLSGADSVGAYAFAGTAVTAVTLKDGAAIGERAFYQTSTLTTANNLSGVKEVGARAFAKTALTEANLSSAETIGEFAFADTNVTSVTLSDNLVTLGDNPFAGCKISAFEKDGETTYDIGDNVKVIEGVLYRVATNGKYELITYPIAESATSYTVADSTVRIGAQAFYKSENLVTVSFPRDVAAIGDKAFYGCTALTVVTFTSVEAPILEEYYDIEYLSITDEDGIPNLYYRAALTGDIEITSEITLSGLGVFPYYSWTFYDYTNVFYGGNFIDLIGEEALKTQTLIMVRPINGTGYDTFIYNQYFDAVIDGSIAAEDATIELIDMILALPAAGSITLNDEAQITAAETAYNALSTLQQAYVQGANPEGVNYYETLSSAVSTLTYLKSLQEDNPSPGNTDETETSSSNAALYVTIAILAALIVVLAAVLFVIQLKQKAANGNAEEAEGETAQEATDEAAIEESDEATEDSAEAEETDEADGSDGSDDKEE